MKWDSAAEHGPREGDTWAALRLHTTFDSVFIKGQPRWISDVSGYQLDLLGMFFGTFSSYIQGYSLERCADYLRINFYWFKLSTWHPTIIIMASHHYVVHHCWKRDGSAQVAYCDLWDLRARPASAPSPEGHDSIKVLHDLTARGRVHLLLYHAKGELTRLMSCEDSTARLYFSFGFVLFCLFKVIFASSAFLPLGAWQEHLKNIELLLLWHDKKILPELAFNMLQYCTVHRTLTFCVRWNATAVPRIEPESFGSADDRRNHYHHGSQGMKFHACRRNSTPLLQYGDVWIKWETLDHF